MKKDTERVELDDRRRKVVRELLTPKRKGKIVATRQREYTEFIDRELFPVAAR